MALFTTRWKNLVILTIDIIFTVHTFGLGTLRTDRRTWKTGFITELLLTSLVVVMTEVSPMRTRETDLLTA